jgi:hypothetical protein
MVLAEPLRVSPLIKTARWGALIAGIWWGGKRFVANKAAEDEVSLFLVCTSVLRIFSLQHRAYVAKMQPIWDAEKSEKANKANRENMIYLANATGTPIPADF